eukprot:1295808-Lingulodinium_polyedra.AAC.1
MRSAEASAARVYLREATAAEDEGAASSIGGSPRGPNTGEPGAGRGSGSGKGRGRGGKAGAKGDPRTS